MRILLIDGDGDYDAMDFESRFPDLDKVAIDVEKAGGVMEYEDAGGEFSVTVSIKTFGDVDPDFIYWFSDKFIDYDMTKSRNFHVLKEPKE